MKQQMIICEQAKLNDAFVEACKLGDLPQIKHLLTSPELELHANINTNGAFMKACVFKQMDVIKYLLTSNDLKEKISLKEAFIEAHILKQHEVLHYLIFELNIQQDGQIESLIQLALEVQKMFDIRHFNEKLHKELSHNIKSKKGKSKL